MASLHETFIIPQLQERRRRLEMALATAPVADELQRLLGEVDSALARVANGSYGLCDVCHDPVEPERLIADPLLRLCLAHLTPEQQRELEQDLETAAQIQRGLLPRPHLTFDGWEVHYRYQPAGVVSGDYCDVVHLDGGDLFFLFGDVSGKGVAAAILMAHLHATFRNLLAGERRVDRLVERANRVFRESALAPYLATLVCGRARASGEIEICNAGHCPPLVVSGAGVSEVDPTGLPVGAFAGVRYASRVIKLDPGDSLVLYTDGLSEARNPDGEEYGAQRISRVLAAHGREDAEPVVEACLADLSRHLAGGPRGDDLTLMVVRRTE
jgi:sigma-B regulation protein RsbU (phosphoserine phosphatase)